MRLFSSLRSITFCVWSYRQLCSSLHFEASSQIDLDVDQVCISFKKVVDISRVLELFSYGYYVLSFILFLYILPLYSLTDYKTDVDFSHKKKSTSKQPFL